MAWWPVPLLLAVIAGLWVADLRTVYESRTLMTLLNLFFTWLASLCICFLTARGFLSSGQPGLLMFGCGSLLWGVTSLSAAVIVDRVNTTITVHNVGVFGAAMCHLVGLLWRGRLPRPGRWLVVGYAGALMTAALIFWAAADRVVIGLRCAPEGVTLTIEDNGVGFPVKTPKKSGMGLRIMNHRASEIGATLSVRRAGKNGGTVVTCTLPCGAA